MASASSTLHEKAPGELVTKVGGAWAFIPSRLPPKIEYDDQLVNDLNAAMLAVGQLDGLVEELPNPYLLVRPLQLREAVASSKIEGTQTELRQLLLFQAAEQPEDAPRDVQEVNNYTQALAYGTSQPPDRRLTVALMKEMHQLLLSGVRGERHHPGELRRTQVRISGDGTSIEEARFVPPLPTALIGLLEDLERYIASDDSLPPLIRLALVHYQFETIHPFEDGNGRLGRLLIPLLMVRWGLMWQPALYVSDFFNVYRDPYVDGLWNISRFGMWREWIDLFILAVRMQALDSFGRARRLSALRRTYEDRYKGGRTLATMLQIIDMLFEGPAVTIPSVEQRLGVTYPTAAKWVRQLVDDGVLTEVTQRPRNRIYFASEIFGLLNARPFFADKQEGAP